MVIRQEEARDHSTVYSLLPADAFGIKAPFEAPRENFMACKLAESAPAVRGTVRYAKEFGIGE